MVKQMRRMKTVHRWEDVPAFESEEEESEFWGTHQLGRRLLAQMKPSTDPRLPPPRPRTRPIAVRFDESTLGRIKALAARRGIGYQTLLKEFVSERLYEEEKREGIVGQ